MTWMTPAQCADHLGVAVGTLANWRSARQGPPYVSIGGRTIRYQIAAVDAWMTAQTVTTYAAA